MSAVLAPRPVPLSPRPWAFPPFRRWELDNGLRVVACDLPGRPLVEVRLVLDVGGLRETEAEEGVALLLARALFEGTAARDADEFAEAAELAGASLTATAGWDAVVTTLSVPATALPAGLALLAEAVAEPRFPSDGVSRLVGERTDEITAARTHPVTAAGSAFGAAAYAPSSRMSRPLGGTRPSVELLDHQGVRRFYERHVSPASATAVVVGDLRGSGVDAALADTLGGWSHRVDGAPSPRASTPPAPGPRVLVADLPGAVQSQVIVGLALGAVGEHEQPALDVAVHALGGYFSSRLMGRLREDLGITYGVRGRVAYERGAATLRIETAVQRDATAVAVEEIGAAVRAVAEHGLDGTEHADAVAHLVRTGPIACKSTAGVAAALADMVARGLPDDHLDRTRLAMAQTTADDARTAFAARVAPDALAVALAGDADVVVGPLAALGYGAPQPFEPA